MNHTIADLFDYLSIRILIYTAWHVNTAKWTVDDDRIQHFGSRIWCDSMEQRSMSLPGHLDA